MSKTVLFLGASHQQLAPIQYSKKAGYRIVTCDNRPDNPGHRLADEYFNVSTADFEGVLDVARKTRIDGVVCYASDVSAPTAAYVSEKLGLPGNPLEAVRVLTNKMLFRRFQAEQGHFTPKNLAFSRNDLKDWNNMRTAVEKTLEFPVVVKPVDANGGKGVSKIYDPSSLASAVDKAAGFSLTNTVIVEELIVPLGYQVCGEGFLQDGRILFHAFANEHFCPDLVVPIGETFPSIFDERLVAKGIASLQAIFSALNMRQGPFNFDLMFTRGGDVFVIEIGPRNGGNRMPEAIVYANQADTIAATVEIALGRRVSLTKETNRFYATYSIHAKHDGLLESIDYVGNIRNKIVDEKMFVSVGDEVKRFNMGSLMLGNLILAFDTYTDMLSTIDHMDDHIRVNVARSAGKPQ